jgi:AraC-binding-like domain
MMSVLVRAEDVPLASRAEYLRDAVRAAVVPLEIRFGAGQELPDQMRAGRVGALRIGEPSSSKPGGADRTRGDIKLLEEDLCKVDVVAKGEVALEHAGRQARLNVGDYAFVDLSRPASWTNAWSTRVVSIAFPRKLIPVRNEDLARLAGIGFGADEGSGAVFSSIARQLTRHFDDLDPASGALVGATTCSIRP